MRNFTLILVCCVFIAMSACSGGEKVDEGTSQIDPGDDASTDPSVLSPSAPPASDVYFNVHSQQDVHAISRFIYGINGHDFEDRPANLTLTRSGGNRLTAYNWETNASNAGTDWYNQNDGYLGGGDSPGGAVTPAIDDALAHHAGCIVTVPMIGYVSADKNGDGDVNQTPDYITTRFHPSYPSKGAAFELPPDLSDHAVYQDEWIYFLNQRYPGAAADSVAPIFFSLDNEPDLWAFTHPRLRNDATGAAGEGVTYAELTQKTMDYAAALKAVEPDAVIFGPVNYGWQGMVDLQEASDAAGRDFLEFYLQRMALAEAEGGRRLLDVMDIHWYPEARGGGVRITGDSSQAEVAAARMQAPRSLWDAGYTEDSWIAQWGTQGPIRLLPRLQDKIDTFYPGTRLAITEYYYGGGDHISGAIAQADVLGIFGREGLFAATLWKLGGTDHRFIYGGFEIFRDYDGNDGAFGDLSIRAQNSNAADSSVYASVDSGRDDRMVLVCINKTGAATTAGIAVTHTRRFNRVDVYTLTSSNSSPLFQGALNVSLINAFQYTMPAYSVSTLVLAP